MLTLFLRLLCNDGSTRLETTAVLLQHQRDDIAKKLSRVRERLADETEKAA